MKSTTVLIVEDEAIVAADLAGKLGQLGYLVVGITAKGEEAVEQACRLKPEVVLMDIRLKGRMDGIEAAEAIRRQIDLPVIYLTAHSDTATLERAKLSQPFGYILKPFEERELATTIEMALFKHQSDRQMREQREWLKVTLTSIGDAVITCDADGRVNFINPVAEELTGWSLEEARNGSIQEIFYLINEQTGQPAEDPMALVLREGSTKVLANHTALVTRDGRVIPIEDSAAPILAADGKIIGVVLVFHDVTEKRRDQNALRESEARLQALNDSLQSANEELKQAKDAAEAANRIKSQFLANMSHELRTPMTGILGMLDLVLARNLEAEQRGYIEIAQTSGHSLVRILNDILDLTKIEKGIFSIEEKPFPVRKCVENTFNILLPLVKSKGLDFDFVVADDVPEALVGDQTRLSQVLTNLTANAVKFTEKGKVALNVTAGKSVSGGKQEFTFSISDTGIGIPDDKKERLFQAFSQVDESHSRSYGGSGLGLVISKEIVKHMGGIINFTSEVGKGSTFYCTIPLGEAEPALDVVSASGKTVATGDVAGSGDTVRPRLLGVEDDSTIRQVLGSMFQMAKYEIDFAENGRKAVEMWESGKYGLILMDVQMPVMNGFDATAAIREKERARGGHIPIIAMTAHAFKEDENKCLDAGMDAYISKPIDFMACLKLIREILENNRFPVR